MDSNILCLMDRIPILASSPVFDLFLQILYLFPQ